MGPAWRKRDASVTLGRNRPVYGASERLPEQPSELDGIHRPNHLRGEAESASVHAAPRPSPVIDKVLSGREINESGLTGRGGLWR